MSYWVDTVTCPECNGRSANVHEIHERKDSCDCVLRDPDAKPENSTVSYRIAQVYHCRLCDHRWKI